MSYYRSCIKPVIDITSGGVLLLLLFPFLVLISLILLILQGRPLFFSQMRPGLKGNIFRLYKFRTMSVGLQNGELLPDIQRLTIPGKILRRFSLDELPQLINVVRGELSLVGPRPLLPEYLSLYNEEQRRRHDVKPGITGWAQVNGRNAITWEEKFKFDVFYVDNISFVFDLKIIFMTIFSIFRSSDIYDRDGLTMEKFKGSRL
jgi:lipopolysaccharide/colanic/teichoic acid biosynthesis glycosyltransferase